MTTSSEEFLTTSDMAATLRRKTQSVRDLLRKEKIPSIRDGRNLLVKRTDFDAYLARREAAAREEAEREKKDQAS